MQFKDLFRSVILSACVCAGFSSCVTVNKEVGENFIPDNEKIKVSQVSIPLPVTLQKMDNMQGRNSSYFVIGNYRTEEFGNASFSSAANLSLLSKMNIGRNAQVKSVKLIIPTSKVQYIYDNQDGQTENIVVYRTKKVLDSTTIYQNSLTPEDYDPTPISIPSSTFLGNDTLSVILDNSLGRDILTATQDQLDTNTLFMERFKGLYITSEPQPNSVIGGRLNLFSVSYAYVEMKINFTPTWKSGLAAKDTTLNFKLGNGFCVNTSSYGDKQDELIGNKNLTVLPTEGIGGLKPYISAKDLKQAIDNWAAANNYNPSKIAVNKATIVLPYTPPTDYDYVNMPSSLYPVYKDTTEYKFYFPVDDIYSEANKGTMNKSLNVYRMDCSSTIQKFFQKSENALTNGGHDMWFSTVNENVNSYTYTTTYDLDTETYYFGSINGPAASQAPRLELLFTVIPD